MAGKLLRGWHSGQVVRKHTMMNLRAENIAEHTWGVVHVLLFTWPKASSSAIILAQYHDFGERATGDIPAPVKWSSPQFGSLCEEMENKYIRENLPEHLVSLIENADHEARLMVEFADRVEFCLSAHREINMGNRYLRPGFMRSLTKAQEASDAMFKLDFRAFHETIPILEELQIIKRELEKTHGSFSE